MNKHQQEFIGRTVVIRKSSNKDQEDLKGKIIDETKNTFTIQTTKKKVMIMKKDKEFMIGKDMIKGNSIMKRPEDRIKIREK
jgi:ribonuclease P protein subunit POP4